MIAVVLGPPGAGKSKQSELLKDRDHIEWLYTGKLLREQNDPAIDKFLDSGQLVEDNIVNKLVASFISRVNPDKVVVIDGFPRHLPQAEWLLRFATDNAHNVKVVIHIMVPDEVSKNRLAKRGREDDSPEAIATRLSEYERDIAPVVSYFERNGVDVRPVDGDRPVEEVYKDMDRILNDVYQGKN